LPTTEGERRLRAAPRTFRLLLEYDGTDFAGFQLQGRGERTVQGVLEAALARLSGGEACRIHGAGRTDAGVHALGQVAHFASAWPIPPGNLAVALNGALPRDLVVRAADLAQPGFHARYDATERVYRYVILNRAAPSALLGRFALHVRERLGWEAMRAAARHLEGVHDFAAFGRPDAPGKSTVRAVRRVDVRPWKDCLLVTVAGNAFLRQMVRSFVGALLAVGRGALRPDDVIAIRNGRDRALCPPVAPAHGLCLVRVEYGGTRTPRTRENENLFGQAE
jgi:tRNA pseudouridine38-40 synthase